MPKNVLCFTGWMRVNTRVLQPTSMIHLSISHCITFNLQRIHKITSHNKFLYALRLTKLMLIAIKPFLRSALCPCKYIHQ